MDTGVVIGIVVVLVVLAAGAVFVRTRRTPSAPEAPDLLDPGWQFYSRPTVLEAPGTVFRIDAAKRRYIVDSLTVQIQKGDEAVGSRRESVHANMGMVARFLGLGPKVDVASEHSENFVFELKGSSREYVEDNDLDPVLNPWIEQQNLREGSRYYVIREAIAGNEITYQLDVGQVDQLGGEARIKAAELKGNLHTSKSKSEYLLKQTFDTSMRVMFLPEELRPLTRGLAEDTVYGLRPVKEPLVWEDDGTE